MKAESKSKKRGRSKYTDEFKAGAVPLVREGRPATQVGHDLGVHPASVYNRLRLAAVDAGKGPTNGLSMDEKAELAALRKENRVLKLERDIPQKPRPSSPERTHEVRVHRGGEGQRPGGGPLPCVEGLAQRLLRVTSSSGVRARHARLEAQGALQGGPRALSRELRQHPHPQGAQAAGSVREPQARGQADAARIHRRQAPSAVDPHH
jgi:transposase